MSNSLFNELGGQVASNGIMNDIAQIRSNPSQLGQYLFQRGKISQQQLSDIQGMNPSQIGQYLVRSGVLGNNQIKQFGNMVGQMFH